MEYIVWFIFGFILIFIIYYLVFIRKAKRKEKLPAEVQYLISLYKLDIKKFSYRKFLIAVGIVTSIDISLVASIVAVVKDITWQILFGFVAVVPVIVVSFMLLGKYYQNKQTKDNSKELDKEKKYLAKLKQKVEKKQNKKGKKKNDKHK